MGTFPHNSRVTVLFFSCLLYSATFCYADSNTVEVVGISECADCAQRNIKTSHAFSGLKVTIDCKAENGEFKTRGVGELNKEGKFQVSLPDTIIEENGKLKEQCYAQLHSAESTPCAAQNGLESSKLFLISKANIDDNNNKKNTLGLPNKLKFSSATCTSAFFWPFFKYPPLSKLPPMPKWQLPPLKGFGHHHFHFHHKPYKFFPPLPPKVFPPPVPVYQKPLPPPFPVYKEPPPVPVYNKPPPPVPVYNKPPSPKIEKPPTPKVKKPCPPKYKKPLPPPVPVYKKPLPPPVPIYKPPPVPIYKPPPVPNYKKPCPPPVPIYKPPPVPIYKPLPPPVPIYKPPPVPILPPPVPIYKKPLPPLPKFPPIYKKPLPPLPKFPPFHKKSCPPLPKLPPFSTIPPKIFHHPKFGKWPPLPPYSPTH